MAVTAIIKNNVLKTNPRTHHTALYRSKRAQNELETMPQTIVHASKVSPAVGTLSGATIYAHNEAENILASAAQRALQYDI